MAGISNLRRSLLRAMYDKQTFATLITSERNLNRRRKFKKKEKKLGFVTFATPRYLKIYVRSNLISPGTYIQYIGLATKWLRIFALGGSAKIRNHLVANTIIVTRSLFVLHKLKCILISILRDTTEKRTRLCLLACFNQIQLQSASK